MNTGNYIQARFDPIRTTDFSEVTDGFVAMGPILDVQPRLINVDNTTDTNIQVSISVDGIIAHFVVPANSGRVYDVCSNRSGPADSLEIPQQQYIWIRAFLPDGGPVTLPTLGQVYATVMYAGNA